VALAPEDEETKPPAHTPAPGRGVEFRIDTRWSLGYRLARGLVKGFIIVWFRPHVIGRENIPSEGPAVLAPVHRSFADFIFAAAVTDRKLFFMAKDSLWKSKLLGRLLLTLGAFPVHRESADREALVRAEKVLEAGQLLVLFPEGARQEGPEVQPLLEGATYLAARAGAPIIPMGIGNSDRAMPKGSKIPKPLRITLILDEPLQPAARSESGRVSRRAVRESTNQLRQAIQVAYDNSRAE
jgi:1-acyl-sn-glycerol-3-phosphate acyltransferase